jgi:hypothetical protein
VHYTVLARDAAGHSAQAPAACGQSAQLRADVRGPLRLAAAGAAALAHPNGFERAYAQSLLSPEARAVARAQFATLPTAQQNQLWQRYWTLTPMGERVRWHEAWVSLSSAAQQNAMWAHLPERLAARDCSMVQAGLWATHNPSYANEPARFFALLTAQEQRLATHAWRDALGPEVARAFDAAMAGSDATQKQAWQTPLMQAVWFDSRDPEEQSRLVHSLAQLDANARRALQTRYMAALPEALRRGLVWPPWESLTPDERDAYLNVPADISHADAIAEGLWPGFLAWVAYEQLDEPAKIEAIGKDAGMVAHTLSRLRYMVRPVDVGCGFRLWLYAGLVVLGFVNGVLLRLVSRQLSAKP